MSNAIFPVLPGLSWGTDWVPRFSTKILTATSGKEYRAAMMSSPVYTFKLQIEFLRSRTQELQTLFSFFLARQGAFDSFLYRHPDDCEVKDQIIGTGNGVQAIFQLVRGLGAGYAEPVQNVNAVTNVKVNGVLKTLGTDYTVTAAGLVIFVTPPTGTVTWSGTYYYRARFTKDDLTFNNMMEFVHAVKGLELTASLGQKI